MVEETTEVEQTSEAQAETTDATSEAQAAADPKPGAHAPISSDGGEATASPADFPDDWRQRLAGEDEKMLKRLERFPSVADLARSYRELEAKMRSGEAKASLPENPTEEQLASWRKENGIPEDPKGYLDALPDGLVVGDHDQGILNDFLEAAHSQNADPKMVGDFVGWYFDQQEQHLAGLAEEDRAYQAETIETLRAEWGADYKDNIRRYESMLESMPAELAGEDGRNLKSARLADGTVLGDNPHFLRWMARMAEEQNPASTLVPAGTANTLGSINEQIAAIEKTMRTDRAAYNKDPAMQQRYRDLLTAQERLSAA